jgi:hypothetical protein
VNSSAVAVELLNGTLIDVAKIDGSPAYVAAMKSLAEDAAGFRGGKKSTGSVTSLLCTLRQVLYELENVC